jgi:hypothetical protein
VWGVIKRMMIMQTKRILAYKETNCLKIKINLKKKNCLIFNVAKQRNESSTRGIRQT